MNLRQAGSDEPELNLTPLIDVVFILLIFFMVSTTFQKESEIKIELPEASADPVEEKQDVLELVIDAEGRYFIEQQQVVNTEQVNVLTQKLIGLRSFVEAAIDFPEEEIDFLSDGEVQKQLDEIKANLATLLANTRQVCLLREGMTLVIAGQPNAGKSSLLNALAGRETAIVTPLAGTTRDLLREHIQIDGLPLHIIDTEPYLP